MFIKKGIMFVKIRSLILGVNTFHAVILRIHFKSLNGLICSEARKKILNKDPEYVKIY